MIANKSSKCILVYGDSYTYGKIPGGARYDSETRFTGVLQKTLGDGYEIIEEGLRGRMISGENKFFPHRDGLAQFDGIVASHLPLDLIVFMLGGNDTNSGSSKTVEQIACAYDSYLEKIAWWCEQFKIEKPKILIIAPPVINEKDSYKAFGDFFKGADERSSKLPLALQKHTKERGLDFFDSSKIVKVSNIDGIHLDEKSNIELGKSLSEVVLKLLSK